MNKAVVTQLTNNFMQGGLLLLTSLTHYNTVSYDIIILVDSTFTEDNKTRLLNKFPDIIFKQSMKSIILNVNLTLKVRGSGQLIRLTGLTFLH